MPWCQLLSTCDRTVLARRSRGLSVAFLDADYVNEKKRGNEGFCGQRSTENAAAPVEIS